MGSTQAPDAEFTKFIANAPGPFSEAMAAALARELKARANIEVRSLSASPGIMSERLEVEVRVISSDGNKQEQDADGNRIITSKGPHVTYVFQSTQTIEENLQQFRDFIASQVVKGRPEIPKASVADV